MTTIDFDNLEIQLVSNKLPDVDMAYLSHAYHLIITEGGFSTVSACLNLNTVYNSNCIKELRMKYNLQQLKQQEQQQLSSKDIVENESTQFKTNNVDKTRIFFRYIFLMGLEGTGHHFMGKIFDQIRDNTNKDNNLSKYFVNRPQSDKSLEFCEIGSSFAQGFTLKDRGPKSLYNSLVRDIRYASTRKENYDLNRTILIAPKLNPSYPFCTAKKKYQAPNIIEIFLLLKSIEKEINNQLILSNMNIKISFDMSIVVSYRTFINSIYSACLRFGDCNTRINRYYNISLPMMMKQIYFFIDNIYNNNINNNNTKINLSNYNNYNKIDFYEKKKNDIIEKKFLDFISNKNNSVKMNSNIKVIDYDKIFEYNNLTHFTLLASNLANLFDIPNTQENILKISTIFYNQVNRITTQAQQQSNISVEQIHKLATGTNMSVKWNVLNQFQSVDDIISQFYSKDENDKEIVLKQTGIFKSKLWTLFYLPQLLIN